MGWTQICCQYDGSYAGFLTCVFECYANREEPVEFRTPDDPCCSLYPLRAVVSDRARAERVYRSLDKLGREGKALAVRGFLTCLPDRELWLWRLLRLGYARGPAFTRDLTDPTVDQLRIGQRTGFEDHFQQGITVDLLTHHGQFALGQIVIARQHRPDVDDRIDLVGSVFDGHRALQHLDLQECLRRRKTARHAGDTHSAAEGQGTGQELHEHDDILRWYCYQHRYRRGVCHLHFAG